MAKKKKSVYQRVRSPWKKSTEKVHDGGKQGKEEKRITNEVDDFYHYDPEDYGDVSDWPL